MTLLELMNSLDRYAEAGYGGEAVILTHAFAGSPEAGPYGIALDLSDGRGIHPIEDIDFEAPEEI